MVAAVLRSAEPLTPPERSQGEELVRLEYLLLKPMCQKVMVIKYDGDQLTYASVKNQKYHVHFLTFCSSYAFIDRSTGYFNRAMGFEREYAAILSVLWDIGKVIDNYVTSPSEETYSALMESGISSPHKIEVSSEESSLDWDGTGLDPIFKIPFNPDEIGVNVHYLTSMFN